MTQTIQNLIQMGGQEWRSQDGQKHRVYFDAAICAKILGLQTTAYGTGNISSATLNGEGISNSAARKMLNGMPAKFWYDVTLGKFQCMVTVGDGGYSGKLAKILQSALED